MAQTVIGFFEDASDARKAVQKLESIGISRANVDLTEGTGSKGSTERVSDSGRDLDKDGRNKNRVTDFFNSLFGSHNSDDAKRYSSVGNSGCSLVTVHA